MSFNLNGHQFYREMSPITEHFSEQAMEVNKLDRNKLLFMGEDPKYSIADFVRWVNEMATTYNAQPIFVAYPLGFDWSFVYPYICEYVGQEANPFKHKYALDMQTYFAAKNSKQITLSNRKNTGIESPYPHSHNALDDAVHQADMFLKMFTGSPNFLF